MVITHNDEQYRTNIRDYLIHRAHAVRVDARGNLMNLAVMSEDFYTAFLNVLFDLHLKNANADKSNTAGIDLIDPEYRVAVQVSLTCAPETIRKKIRESMRKFDKPGDEVWQFYFVPITDEAPELKKDFSLPEGLTFDKDHDVLDIARLMILASDRHKLGSLSRLVNQYSKRESDLQVLRDSLDRLLLETWKNHRSYKLMHTDDIDRRLYPGIKDGHQFEVLGRRKEGETESPVWTIIRESWKEPENHPVMIEGKGGIGKTVTLFSVTEMDKDSLQSPAVYVPMFELIGKNGEIINLTEFFHSCEPFSSLPEEQRNGICALASQPWNHGPSLLVLLDGFNEVPGECRWEVLKMLHNWHKANTGAQLIAVSRPMDNLRLKNAFGDSTIAITLSELKREIIAEYLKNLKEDSVRLPESKSPVWDTIVYPLFLTLYIKSERLRDQSLWKDYPMRVRGITGPGSLIWNYLQRELLRQEDEGWILRCALACEYIVPELAYQMLKKYVYTISQSEAVSIIQNTVSEMDWEHLPGHLSKLLSWWKWQNVSTGPSYFLKDTNWPTFVLRETGLLTPYRESKEGQHYEFFHQSFRDCMAGLYLVNQAEMITDNAMPEVWRHGQNHLALDYAAELMDGSTAEKLWEINRKSQQYDSPGYERKPSGTYALLELQKRRSPLPENLDFSGMDLREMSLVRYISGGKDSLPLFHEPRLSNDTKLDCSAFRSEGHSSSVNCILVLSDERVVSGSSDGSLRVWEPSDGRCLQTLKGHSGPVLCMAALPDGRVVSGSSDGSLRVWDPSNGRCLQTLQWHPRWTDCVAVLPDGRVVSGSSDGSLRVWDPSNGRCLQTLKGHSESVSYMVVLPDGRIVSSSNDGSMRVWDPSNGRCLQTLHRYSEWDSCVAALPDGRVVSGSDNGSLQVWDPSNGRCLQTLEEHLGSVSCVAVLPDGRVVSGSRDHSLRVWDPSDGRCLQTLKGHSGSVSCVAVLSDGRIVSGSSDGSLRVWDPSDGRCLQTLKGHSDSVSCVAVLPDGRVVSGSSDGSLRVWDPSDGRCLQTLKGHSGSVSCVAALPDGRVVSGSDDGSLRVWDPSDGRCLKTLQGHSDWVRCVAVLPDGCFVSGSRDHSLRVWDPSDGRCLQTLKGHSGSVNCVAILPDGHVVSGSSDGSLRVWDPSDGRYRQVLEWHSHCVSCMAVLHDGRVVINSDHSFLLVWNPLNWRCLQMSKGHSNRVSCVAVLPDGHVVSGSDDCSLRLWNPSDGRCLQTLKGHTGSVNCVAVLPDGCIVSGSTDGTIKIWDLNTGKYIESIKKTEIDVSRMDLSQALLSNDLAKLLWQNGAKISDADYEKYVCSSMK